MKYDMNRRGFLQGAGLGVAAWALSRAQTGDAEPYGIPVGLQLYTVRDHIEHDLEGTLAQVANIGYTQVELGGFDYYGKTPAELRRILKRHGLTPLSRHFREDQLKSDLERQIAGARECGIAYLGLASLAPQDRKSLDAIQRDAEWFNQVGHSVRRAGGRFFYHGHNFDYATVHGAVEYDELIRRTEPGLVSFELDCFWCVRAGKSPVDYFHRYPGRFPQLHIKDLKPGYPPTTGEDFRRGAFTEVGRGVIDWKAIFQAAPQGGLKHYYVEQDECDGDSLQSARISYDYLYKLKV